jgi:hypothetical protein
MAPRRLFERVVLLSYYQVSLSRTQGSNKAAKGGSSNQSCAASRPARRRCFRDTAMLRKCSRHQIK